MSNKRRCLLPALVAVLFVSSGLAQTTFYFAQIGNGEIANIRFQTTLIFVNTGPDVMITVEFFSTAEGAPPLQVDLGDLGTDSQFSISLNQGQSISLPTSGEGSIQVGYARITIPAGGSVGGTAVFTRTDIPSGVILYEAGVPAVRSLKDFTVFVDTIGDRDTGLAIVNANTPSGVSAAGTDENQVTMTLYDTDFNQIATTNVPLPEGEHDARFVSQIFSDVPQASEMLGSVGISSPDDLAAVTLRQNDGPSEFPDDVATLTAFPVIEGRANAAGSFSILPEGQVAVALDLSAVGRDVVGAIFHLYEGDSEAVEMVRGFEADTLASLVLPATTRSGRIASVDRVEVALIYRGDRIGPRFALNR